MPTRTAEMNGGQGALLDRLSIPEPRPGPVPKISGMKAVASYNWKEGKNPVIIVPGSPPHWKPTQLPFTVGDDTDPEYINLNGAKSPSSAFEPLLRALQLTSPTYPLHQVDIVTDRNNLRKLLRWLSRAHDLTPFRIDAELAGKGTVLLTRREERDVDLEARFRGFGHNFAKSYDFGNLAMLVRSHIDAMDAPPGPAAVEDLTLRFEDLSVNLTAFSNPPSQLSYIKTGPPVVEAWKLMEIKTRAEWKRDSLDWDEIYPQLLLSGTPMLVLGLHQRGTFGTIEQIHVTEIAKKQSKTAEEAMKGLKAVLAEMKTGRKLAFVCDEQGEMKVYERTVVDPKRELAKELLERFWAPEEEGDGESEEEEGEESEDGADTSEFEEMVRREKAKCFE
ncbi:uncharacterized protein EV422DRAFT_569936 [Fimicolochytrium jonesii]|uniref:uncharacterized protein n=1 Tax=Fimicolochytrium jonesii TaxID=1396493 RepID=UPI0022FECA22|nr:uncharacterized protein EV422DRAFT_569936 [Fimicolochytrium jonesii]KAI8818150.1 hypothetical protein EV422DRAFT_569936 [Fimicolochytrium jonesii]